MTEAVVRAAQVEIRCHRCSYHIGETPEAVEFVGVVRMAHLRNLVAIPRLSWRCKCGWLNIYRPLDGLGASTVG